MKKVTIGILGIALTAATMVGSSKTFAEGENPYDDFNWYYVTTSTELSRGYGWYGSEFHKGIDVLVTKQPVYSPQSGTVISAGYWADAGNYVAIKTTDTSPDNSNKLIVRNLHLDSIAVSTSKPVTRGQKIGVSGNTGGNSTGYHLHFDVNDANTISGSQLNESNTINPIYFWPSRFNAPTVVPLNEDAPKHDEQAGDQVNWESLYDDPETYFEDTLVEYVGKEKFLKWLLSKPVKERKLSNFKKEFNISDKLEKELREKPWKK